MKKLLDISSEERNRILEMHKTATRKNYLTEAQFNPSVNLIFCNKEGQVLNIKGDTNWSEDAQKMQVVKNNILSADANKFTGASIERGTYSPGEIASASFYLMSYEISERARGGGVGIISSFEFSPQSDWVKKYGNPVVTLDYSQKIQGFKAGAKADRRMIGGLPLIESNPPTQFVLKFTTPTKKIDVTGISEIIGVATIKTNDISNPVKKITLYALANTQFGVATGAPSSAPTTASPRT